MLLRSTIPPPAESSPLLQPLRETEARLIVQALEQTKSVPQAAALLGLHHSTLYRKLKKYKIDLPLNPTKEES
jgi:transcriptional regulator with PAS, ATPase and Fis domain